MSVDVVSLFELPHFVWSDFVWDKKTDIVWDPDNESMVNASGVEVSLSQAVTAGAMVKYWQTETVFADADSALEWGRRKAYNYPDGWDVRRVPVEWGPSSPHPGRTHDVLLNECTRDPVFLGQVSVPVLHSQHGSSYWRTERVFLTRADGDAWLQDLGPKTRRAFDRVYCVPATGVMCALLADRTVGGRYS